MCGCRKKAEPQTSAQTSTIVASTTTDDEVTLDDGIARVTQKRSESTRR
jgi:hypothetical protein